MENKHWILSLLQWLVKKTWAWLRFIKEYKREHSNSDVLISDIIAIWVRWRLFILVLNFDCIKDPSEIYMIRGDSRRRAFELLQSKLQQEKHSKKIIPMKLYDEECHDHNNKLRKSFSKILWYFHLSHLLW